VSRRRRAALAVGTTAAGVGLALVVRPGLAGGLGVGETAVLVLGALALAYAVLPVGQWRGTRRRAAPGDEPEVVPACDPPGDDVDRLFAAVDRGAIAELEARAKLRRRLEHSAARAVARRDDCSRDAAREALAAGTWTDDPVAAAYFAERQGDVAAALPAGRRLRFHLAPGSPRARAARRVVDEITAITETGGGR